ncbi:DUF1232 domain-containing protein [Hymenobacter sp. BRD128]|uniref:YkvA family protein n=1 Tax=Hymenobacter sp. BRD128 TaxID=2675878 RepID=UPI001566DAA4|nr:YkvA family protein [Hymenobacter sp. BRD128]QKG56692.1 DUF1232 domain-containing protein [Hymenobacter sp. BRD128]
MPTLAQRGLQISKNVLFSLFINRAAKLLGKPFKVITVLNETADKLADENSKDNKFKQLFITALALVRMMRSYITGEYRQIQTSTVISGLAVLLYVLSPVDLIPDFIPVVGFLDDLSLISWFVGKFHIEITRYRDWEMQITQLAAANPAQGDPLLPAMAELGHS